METKHRWEEHGHRWQVATTRVLTLASGNMASYSLHVRHVLGHDILYAIYVLSIGIYSTGEVLRLSARIWPDQSWHNMYMPIIVLKVGHEHGVWVCVVCSRAVCLYVYV